MSATQAVQRAALALVEKADADSAVEGELTDEQWDEMLVVSHVVSGVTREVSGRPELIARTVLAALDVEELAQELHRLFGFDMPWVNLTRVEKMYYRDKAADLRAALLGGAA